MSLNQLSTMETSVPPAVLLNHHLKQLRLPTFVREHEKVARNALKAMWTISVTYCACANSNTSTASGATSRGEFAKPSFRKSKGWTRLTLRRFRA